MTNSHHTSYLCKLGVISLNASVDILWRSLGRTVWDAFVAA